MKPTRKQLIQLSTTTIGYITSVIILTIFLFVLGLILNFNPQKRISLKEILILSPLLGIFGTQAMKDFYYTYIIRKPCISIFNNIMNLLIYSVVPYMLITVCLFITLSLIWSDNAKFLLNISIVISIPISLIFGYLLEKHKHSKTSVDNWIKKHPATVAYFRGKNKS